MLPIKVPPLGESIVEATVSKWHKKEGDAVAAGDTIVELDTDKITVEVPAQKPGVLGKRLTFGSPGRNALRGLGEQRVRRLHARRRYVWVGRSQP